MKVEEVKIHSDYVTLGQLLKITDCIQSGGEAKHFLDNATIHVNGERENRRGKKLYPHDRVKIDRFGTFIITKM